MTPDCENESSLSIPTSFVPKNFKNCDNCESAPTTLTYTPNISPK